MRTERITKKLHKIWLIDAASEIVLDKNIENYLWSMPQGGIREFIRKDYLGSEAIIKHDLNISVIRGPIEGHWLYKKFDKSELNLFFYATNFPKIAHGWTLYEEDRNT